MLLEPWPGQPVVCKLGCSPKLKQHKLQLESFVSLLFACVIARLESRVTALCRSGQLRICCMELHGQPFFWNRAPVNPGDRHDRQPTGLPRHRLHPRSNPVLPMVVFTLSERPECAEAAGFDIRPAAAGFFIRPAARGFFIRSAFPPPRVY